MPLPRNDCNAMLDPRALRVAPGDHLDAGVFRPHLEAANMRASQHRDRETAADGRDVFRRIFEPQIQFSAGECFLNASRWHGHIWDTYSGRELLQLRGHGGDVYGARFSTDGTRVVTASGDHKVRVWDTETGAQIVQFAVGGDAFDAVFTRNGDYLIVGLDDGGVEAFDVRWVKERRENLVRRVCKEKLTDIKKFTPDDNLNPVLSGFGKTNPCERTGPLTLLSTFLQKGAGGFRQWYRLILSRL
jgi:WD40 repeat protein